MKLWHVRHSRSLRVLWLAKEMGLPLEVALIPHDRAYFAGPDWARLNPTGKVPLFRDGDASMGESVAIMQYLMARHGPTDLDVPPSDPEFADCLFWLHYSEAGAAPYAATLLGHLAGMADYQVPEAHEAMLRAQIDRAQRLVEAAVADRPHLLARGFSAADIAMGYTLHLIRLTKTPFRPGVKDWMDRLYARPAFSEALALGK